MSLNAILFPEYRRRVLGLLLLHPDQRYYLREIARLTGTTAGTLTRELSKLVKAGVVSVRKVGNRGIYPPPRTRREKTSRRLTTRLPADNGRGVR